MRTHHACLASLLVVLTSLSVSAVAHAEGLPTPADPGRLFRLVNAGFDSVTVLEVAEASTASYERIALGEPLQGGLTSITVRLPEGTCLRDVRATFRDGRRAVYPDIDVCKATGLRLSARALPAAH